MTSTAPSTSTIGNRRRSAASASAACVCAFSRTSSASRASCQVARSTTGGRAVPVVVLTAKDLTAEDHERLSGGVQKILRKQVSESDDLLREVGRLLGRTAREETLT